ncbi:hypothetical protein Bca101_072347 [Brassica carinata]
MNLSPKEKNQRWKTQKLKSTLSFSGSSSIRHGFSVSVCLGSIMCSLSFENGQCVFDETLLKLAAIIPDDQKFNQQIDLFSFYNSTWRSHLSYFRFMSRPIDSHRERKYIIFKCSIMLHSLYVFRYWLELRNLRFRTHKKAYGPEAREETSKFLKFFFDIDNIYGSR